MKAFRTAYQHIKATSLNVLRHSKEKKKRTSAGTTASTTGTTGTTTTGDAPLHLEGTPPADCWICCNKGCTNLIAIAPDKCPICQHDRCENCKPPKT
jgi:rubrerythrin